MLQPHDRARVEQLCKAYGFKPFSYYGEIAPRRLAKYFYQVLSAKCRQGIIYGCIMDNWLEGVLLFEELPWDSVLFGVPMAKIELYLSPRIDSARYAVALRLLAEARRCCARNKIQHLTCKVNTRELSIVHAVERHAFQLMDTITTLCIRLDEFCPPARTGKADVRIREICEADLPYLAELSRTIFTNRDDIVTRFNSDPILQEKAGDLYTEWLMNSYKKEQADIVFVAEAAHRPIGFIACKAPSEQVRRGLGASIGSIPLNAVGPTFRGRGVYTRLLIEALKWFQLQGADYVEIKTQIHTLGVHHVWHRLNGRLAGSSYVFHQWRGCSR